MSINITDEFHAATTKGKIASAKEVFLTGDKENLQQIGEKTHQLEEAIKNISVTGGASTASAVSYDNSKSGIIAVTAQGAVDEVVEKNKAQDATIATKANRADIEAKIAAEKSRVDTELGKKFDKENIVQELGDEEDKVVSQAALPFKEIENPEFIHCILDAEEHLLFGIQQDGSVEWGKGVPAPVKERIEEIIVQNGEDKASLTETVETVKSELTAVITSVNEGQTNALNAYKGTTDESIASLQETKVDKEEGKGLIEDEVKEHFSVIENEEWLCAMVDAEGHVLFGIKADTGKPYYPLNKMYHVEQNEEFFAVWIDEEDHVLMGIKRDGQFVGEINAVNILKETVAAIQESIALLRGEIQGIDILSLYPPKNMVPILSNLNWHGHILGNEYTPSPLVLLWFSDLHQDATRLKRIMTFYTKYKEFFDGIIHTGDAVDSSWEDGFDFWNECGAQEVLNLCGNHDTWTNGESGVKAWQGAGYSAKQGFERYIKPYLEMWKVTNNPENTMYWYKDFEDSKIRLIALDNYHNKEKVVLTNGAASDTYPNGDIPDKGEQLDWLKGALVDAKTEGYSVICACHNPSNEYDRIECSFMTLDPQAAGGLPSEWIEAVEDFITDGGEFIVWLCGHNHQDWFCHIKDHPKQLLITVDTARGRRDNGKEWSNSTKPNNTVAEDCFNLISFEPYKGYIRIYRIGIDYDRHMRHIGQLVYDYRNQELIWNS